MTRYWPTPCQTHSRLSSRWVASWMRCGTILRWARSLLIRSALRLPKRKRTSKRIVWAQRLSVVLGVRSASRKHSFRALLRLLLPKCSILKGFKLDVLRSGPHSRKARNSHHCCLPNPQSNRHYLSGRANTKQVRSNRVILVIINHRSLRPCPLNRWICSSNSNISLLNSNNYMSYSEEIRVVSSPLLSQDSLK